MNTHFNIRNENSRSNSDAGWSEGALTAVDGSLRAPLSTINAELSAIKNGLGWIDTAIVDRRINREAKKILGDAYMQMLVAKREELITKITLGLDETKKRALIESLRISGEVDNEITHLSADFTTQMLNGALGASFEAAKEEHRKIQEFRAAQQSGELTEARASQLCEAATEAADHITTIVKDNCAHIIRTHIEKVQLALELFKQKVLRNGI
jgi:hypothetical protein